jgi:hypothetical protein
MGRTTRPVMSSELERPSAFPPPRGVRTTGRRASLAVLLLLALTLAADSWRLEQKNVWLDEAFSWRQAAMPLGSLVRSTAADDIHPPLYYALLRAWTGLFGDAPAGLRGLSVLASLLAMALAYRLGSGFLAAGPLLAALAWLAVSPFAVFYAQEARMYALLGAAVLGACLAYRRWIDSGLAEAGALAWFAACGAAALYLHYFAALALAAIWVHLAALLVARARRPGGAASWRRPLLAWGAANGAIAVACLPWLPFALAQIGRGQAWRRPVGPSEIPGYLASLVRDWFLGYYRPGPDGSPPATLAAAAVIAVAGVGLAGLTVRLLGRRGRERDAFLACLCVVPPVVAAAALPLTGEMELSRYLSFLLPLLLVAIARGWSALVRDRRLVAAALGLAAAASLPATAAYYGDPVHDSDVRPLVACLQARLEGAGPSRRAAVLVAPGFMSLCTSYVSRRQGLAYTRVDEAGALWPAVAAAERGRPPGGVWLIVDRRWPGFDRLAADPRLSEVSVGGRHRDRIVLFTVRRPAASR